MKRKSFKVLLVLTVSFFIVSFVGMACTDELKADDEENGGNDYPVIIQKLAEKLNLDPEKVLEAFEDIKKEKKEELRQNFKEKLDEAVEEGLITEDQKEAIIAKKEEVIEKIQEVKDLPLRERREAIEDILDDLKEWAEENDIDLKDLFPPVRHRPIIFGRFRIDHIFKLFRR